MKRWWVFWCSQILAGLIFKILCVVSCVTFGLLFFRLKVVGVENLPKSKMALIMAPNHKTYVDHFFILGALPWNTKFLPARALAADWLYGIPNYKLGFIIRWGLMAFGCYPARRGNGLNISLRDPLRVLAAGGTVVIYPEGGIRFRKGVHEVKSKGTAYMALKSGAAILPIGIRGLEYLTMRSFLFGRRTVTVNFGVPFHVEQGRSQEEISQLIREKISELYEEPRP